MTVGLPNHLLTLADRAPALLLPVLITELLSPTQNAYWYAVWMMAWVVFIIPVQVGMTLFAEASHGSKPLGVLVRQGVKHALVLGVGAAVVLELAAPLALSVLGHRYADAGTAPLRILLISLVPMTFVQAYYVVGRARRRLTEATIAAAVTGVAGVTAAALAGQAYGLEGVAIAWVVVQLLAGGWAAARLAVIARAGGVSATTTASLP